MKLNDIQDKDIAPEGVYNAKYDRYTLRPKAKEMLLIHFTIMDGMHEGVEVTDLAMLREEKDLWKLKKILTGLQVPEDEDFGNPLDETDDVFMGLLDMLKGAMVKIGISVRVDNQGVKRNNILEYAPILSDGNFEPEELEDEPEKKTQGKKFPPEEEKDGEVEDIDGEQAPDWAKDLID